MMYVIRPLAKGQVQQAYPLVRTAAPHLTLEQWTNYAGALCDGRRQAHGSVGVMSAQDPDGYIYGIYCHEVECDIRHGRVLKVSNLVTASLYDSVGMMDRMIDSMIEAAHNRDCVAVHVDLPREIGYGPQPVEGAAGLLRDAGYQLASVALCRPVHKK